MCGCLYCTFTLVLISFQFYGEIFDLCIMTCKLIFPVSVVFDEVTSFFTMVKHIFLFLMFMFPWQSWFLSSLANIKCFHHFLFLLRVLLTIFGDWKLWAWTKKKKIHVCQWSFDFNCYSFIELELLSFDENGFQ